MRLSKKAFSGLASEMGGTLTISFLNMNSILKVTIRSQSMQYLSGLLMGLGEVAHCRYPTEPLKESLPNQVMYAMLYCLYLSQNQKRCRIV